MSYLSKYQLKLLLVCFIGLQVFSFPLQLGEVVELQRDYEVKAQSVLNRYFGPDQVLVNVIVFTKNSNITTISNFNEKNQLKNQPMNGDQASANNLPGYSVLSAQQNRMYDSVSQINRISQQTATEKDISRIEATLIVPVKFTIPAVQQAQQIVSTVLKLDTTRGDKLTVMKLDFKDEKTADLPFSKRFAQTVQSNEFIKIYVVYAFILLIVLIVVLAFLAGIIILSSRLRKNTNQVVVSDQGNANQPTQKETDESAMDEFGDMLSTTTVKQPTFVSSQQPTGSSTPQGVALSLLPMDQLGKLAYLIKNEAIEKQLAVFNYLRPEVAARLLELFPLNTQKAIVLNLSEERKLLPDEVRVFVADIESQLDYTLGGKAFTSQLFDFINVETSQSILDEVRKDNKGLADEISKSIYVFSDLQFVEKGVIASIVRSVGVKEFSIAMSDEPEAFREVIYSSVSEGVGELVKQSLSLLRRQPRSVVAEAKQKVVLLIKRLNKEGLVADKGLLTKVANDI